MQWDNELVQEIVRKWQYKESILLPILQEIQRTFGYIDARAIDSIVDILGYPRSEVHGVISFYHDFRQQPANSKHLHICCAEACQAMGSRSLVKHLEQSYQTPLDSSNDSYDLTVEKVYCLGNCACAPAVLYKGELFGRVDSAKIDELVKS